MKDPYRQLEILQQALQSNKSKISFLIGAGCPVSIKDADNNPLIPDINGLTLSICEKLKDKRIAAIKNRIPVQQRKPVTIEDILTHVRLLNEVVGSGKIDDFSKVDLEDLESAICLEISTVVNKELPNSDTPYHKLATWVQGIPRNNAIEIFTPNYDLLIETALESKRIPYFDGFVGSKKAFFDLHAIEHEILPPRWVKLWKLHGSTNWWNDANNNVFRGQNDSETDKQMIFPSHLKYDQSRRMPYLAMQDRLGNFLATGQAILVVCGYSFADQHLNAIIMQRLSSNPRAICFGLLYDNLDNYPTAIECAKKTTNLTLLAKNGAYIGGQKKNWSVNESDNFNNLNFCIEKKAGQNDSAAQITCTIGDFKTFGQFLFNQIGYDTTNTVEANNED